MAVFCTVGTTGKQFSNKIHTLSTALTDCGQYLAFFKKENEHRQRQMVYILLIYEQFNDLFEQNKKKIYLFI